MGARGDPVEPDGVAAELARSRKYRFLCDQTLSRVAGWAASRGGTRAEAVKRAKRKLHQVYAAYLDDWDADRARAALDAIADDPSSADVRAACREIMSMHASTAERLDVLERFYGDIFAVTGPPRLLLDIGCGLSPFAAAWMHLPDGAAYLGWEIDRRLVDLSNRFLSLTGHPGRAECRDVLAETPAAHADVTLLLKMLPCLQRQDRRCGPDLLARLPGRFLVVSFPTRSLSGRGRNMPANYAGEMGAILDHVGWAATRIDFPAEMVFVIRRS